MIQLLRYHDYRAMPWKNGQGMTREVCRSPAQGEYDWRISLATITQSGPFSRFDGYLRNISVLEGGGMHLTIDGEHCPLLTRFQALDFSGASAVECQVVSGPLLDFNVIYRADRVRATVLWSGEGHWQYESGIRLLFNAGDNLTVHIDGQPVVLQRYDSLLVDRPVPLIISDSPGANIARVTLFSRSPH
ncbi:HutD family protein [Shimwellia pseudoproteus]|uniref:HutD/Ves family protein n=1 Tax=Shimwellia pseudoproteus TaxID=570012 RepID=UPI0018ECE81B|nr:HutD family protein [Shimwellia pseudoproteus]MBJ3814952.1 HutD family protein [Shimwellia pseudoproteus]